MKRVLSLLVLVSSLAAAGWTAESGEANVAAPDPKAVLGDARGPALSGAALDAEAERVAGLLRCPVCQGLSVGDSPTTMAQNMRQQVRELVAAGYDEEQILTYFEKSYGEFVRLEPPLRGVNWIVWVGPIVGLLLGAFAVRSVLRARTGGTTAAAEAPLDAPPTRDALPEDPGLARYVLRVREQVYGWPGGVAPGSKESAS